MNELVINFVSWVTLFHLLFSFVITMFQWRSLVAWNLSLVGLVEFTVFPEYLKQGTVVFESNFMNESCINSSCLFNFMMELRVVCINEGHYHANGNSYRWELLRSNGLSNVKVR